MILYKYENENPFCYRMILKHEYLSKRKTSISQHFSLFVINKFRFDLHSINDNNNIIKNCKSTDKNKEINNIKDKENIIINTISDKEENILTNVFILEHNQIKEIVENKSINDTHKLDKLSNIITQIIYLIYKGEYN